MGSRWCVGRSATVKAWAMVTSSRRKPLVAIVVRRSSGALILPKALLMAISRATTALT